MLSLYQGLGTKNVQSFISSFIYFYGYSYFRKMYLKKTGNKSIGTTANLIVATAAGVCTIVITQASIIVIVFWRKNIVSYLDVMCFPLIFQLIELS